MMNECYFILRLAKNTPEENGYGSDRPIDRSMTHFRYLDAQIKKAIRRNGFESGSCFDRKVLSARPVRPTVCWPHKHKTVLFLGERTVGQTITAEAEATM